MEIFIFYLQCHKEQATQQQLDIDTDDIDTDIDTDRWIQMQNGDSDQ